MRGVFVCVKHTAQDWTTHARCVCVCTTHRAGLDHASAVCLCVYNTPRRIGPSMRGVSMRLRHTAQDWTTHPRCVCVSTSHRARLDHASAVCLRLLDTTHYILQHIGSVSGGLRHRDRDPQTPIIVDGKVGRGSRGHHSIDEYGVCVYVHAIGVIIYTNADQIRTLGVHSGGCVRLARMELGVAVSTLVNIIGMAKLRSSHTSSSPLIAEHNLTHPSIYTSNDA